MKTVRGLLVSTSAAFALFVVLVGTAGPAPAAQSVTVDARDLLVRMQRMERDIRDLQAETFRRPPGAPADAAPAPPTGAMPDLSPIMRRMDEFGDSLTRLTGQMEELSHQVDLLSQKADRLQKEMDYQAQQAAQAQTAPPPAAAGAAPTAAGSEVASLAPPSDAAPGQPQGGVLGQLPADADIAASAPSGAPDAKAEFDTAMALLTRGQTMPASEAFRAFVAAHPDDERAPTALYWTGDIAYSTTKDYEGAARNFVELLKKYPLSARAPEGMLKLGLALLELGQMKEGCAALAALPAKYPAASPAIATRARNERRDNKCR